LVDASTLKREVVEGVDIMIVRELVGGIYFGQPRGFDTTSDGFKRGFNTMVYSEPEIERIAKVSDRFSDCSASFRRRSDQRLFEFAFLNTCPIRSRSKLLCLGTNGFAAWKKAMC
jgi:hypothetical protein